MNDMNDKFVEELLAIACECQKAGISNDAIIHELSKLRHRSINKRIDEEIEEELFNRAKANAAGTDNR